MKKVSHQFLISLLFFATACSTQTTIQKEVALPTLTGERPLIIGHRGAPGYLPEHTLESYMMAIDMGADFIEPDLVSTKDKVLIVRHEPFIGNTTDVADKFPNRKKKKYVDIDNELKLIDDYFVEDFTLAEIKTLRAKQASPKRDQSHNGKYQVATFEEVIQLALKKSKELGRTIGIYPETKHPSYFKAIGLAPEERLLKMLKKYGLDKKESPVFIQSFEVSNLKELHKKTPVRLIQLLDDKAWQPYDIQKEKGTKTFGDMMTPAGLQEVATYASGIGPWKDSIVEVGPDKKLLPANTLVQDAHKAGLLVHAYTFRVDTLHPDYKGDSIAEYKLFSNLGVDGFFSDFSDVAVKALRPL